jgi:hypothetical protein
VQWLRQKHHAFGDARNVILRGYEHEGESISTVKNGRRASLLRVYRPDWLEPHDWNKLSLTQREEAVGSKPPWSSLVRHTDSPSGWRRRVGETEGEKLRVRERLEDDGEDTFELKPEAPVDTLHELLRQVKLVRRHLAPDGRTQYNVSFLHDPEYADEIATLAAHASEVVTLRMLAGSPLGVANRHFGMYPADQVARLRSLLAASELLTLSDVGAGFKRSSFAVRSDPHKYGEGRVVFELRAITQNAPDARRVLVEVEHFLEDPRGAVLRLGRKSGGATVAQLKDVERLGPQAVARLPAQVQALLKKTAEAVTPHADDLVQRWSVPMVPWELRPGVPEAVRSVVVQERQRFVSGLEELAREAKLYGRSDRVVTSEVAERVHEFARRTQVHQYL